MYIFELVVPGSSLIFPTQTPRARWELEDMLEALRTLFYEANVALNLFEQSRNVPDPDPSYEAWQGRSDRKRELEEIVEQERGPSTDFFKTDIRLEAEARFKREEWAAGKPPIEFEHRITFIYAKAFVSALDGFDRLLEVITKTDGVPQAIASFHDRMTAAFPDLREVRNSTQHHEDRVRSQGRRGKPLDLQPITNGMVPPELPVLALNNIEGSKYCTTMADGHYGEVDITPESMEALRQILQDVINAFSWEGPVCHLPGYGRLG